MWVFDLDTQIQTLIFQGEYRKWSFLSRPILWKLFYGITPTEDSKYED